MSQKDFSSQIGMAERTYIRLENGETDRLSVDSLAALSRLGANLDALVASSNAEPAGPLHAVPDWLQPLLPELANLEKSGRDQLIGWIKGYLSAQAPSRGTKSRNKKAG
ncbi:MAG: helix-turn-helix transcriptional regulator [Deltaproteobacteria bacterium]|nr:helix-turn-helix transcriptional regulator [Deltaproteobacteria bacterium]